MTKTSLVDDDPEDMSIETQMCFLEFIRASKVRILDEIEALENGNMNEHVRTYRQGRLDGMRELMSKLNILFSVPEEDQLPNFGPFRTDARQ